MVVRRRFRAFLVPLTLYSLSVALSGYFLHHAHSGHRGIAAKQELHQQIQTAEQELEAAKTDRLDWERRISLLRSDLIDRDLLEERARLMLGEVHRNDVVIMLNQ